MRTDNWSRQDEIGWEKALPIVRKILKRYADLDNTSSLIDTEDLTSANNHNTMAARRKKRASIPNVTARPKADIRRPAGADPTKVLNGIAPRTRALPASNLFFSKRLGIVVISAGWNRESAAPINNASRYKCQSAIVS